MTCCVQSVISKINIIQVKYRYTLWIVNFKCVKLIDLMNKEKYCF